MLVCILLLPHGDHKISYFFPLFTCKGTANFSIRQTFYLLFFHSEGASFVSPTVGGRMLSIHFFEHFPIGVYYQYIFFPTIKEAAVHHGKQPHIAKHLLQAQLNIVNVLPFLYSVAFLFVFQPHHQVHSLRLQQCLSSSQVFVALPSAITLPSPLQTACLRCGWHI